MKLNIAKSFANAFAMSLCQHAIKREVEIYIDIDLAMTLKKVEIDLAKRIQKVEIDHAIRMKSRN